MSILRVIPAMFTKRWILTTLLVLLGAAVCIRLGIWQLDRLDQRRAFNAQVTSMRALPPLELAESVPSDISTQDYRAVIVRGTFDFANQVAIRNQYLNEAYGYNLLTPLRLADGSAVLVDRGWIPAEGNDSPQGWRRYDGPEQAQVEGVIRLGQAAASLGGRTDPPLAAGQTRLDFWSFVNLDRLALQIPYPIAPVYIQQSVQAGPNLPVPHPEEIELTEGPHFGYALQWFTFATILVLGYPFFLRKQETEHAS